MIRFPVESTAVGALLLGAALALGAPAHADRVILTNGNALEGRAELLEDGSVALHSAMGTWTVAAHRVARVERSETAQDLVEARLRAAGEPTADLLHDLAVEAREAGAETLARQLAQRAIELDPDHEAARRLLGYRRAGQRWLSEAEWRVESGHAAEERREQLTRGALDLARLELDARLRVEAARLSLLERAVEERSRPPEPVVGFPLGWVLAAPTAPVVPSPWPGVPFGVRVPQPGHPIPATGSLRIPSPFLERPGVSPPRAAPAPSRPALPRVPPRSNRGGLVAQPPSTPP